MKTFADHCTKLIDDEWLYLSIVSWSLVLKLYVCFNKYEIHDKDHSYPFPEVSAKLRPSL